MLVRLGCVMPHHTPTPCLNTRPTFGFAVPCARAIAACARGYTVSRLRSLLQVRRLAYTAAPSTHRQRE